MNRGADDRVEEDTMTMKPGSRWRSAVDTTEVILVRAPSEPLSLECGGAPMVELTTAGEPSGAVDPAHAAGTQLGKRYTHDLGLEVLCTKPGEGSLAVNGQALAVKETKPLPSSD
jgi:hypothetical protein